VGEVNFKLVLATARLTDSVAALNRMVASLTSSVSQVTNDVNGGSGVRVEIKDLRSDVRDTDRKIADISGKLEGAMAVFWRVAWFLVLVGTITVITEIRSFAPMILGGGK
jgi:hypothetical protein